MSKFIAEGLDIYGNRVYITSFDKTNVNFDVNIQSAILLTEDDKKVIKKVLNNESCLPHFKFIKLEKHELKYKTASPILLEYDYSHLFDAVKFINGQDYMTLGCIETAKTDLNGIDTFKQFGEIVAQQLIEKYNLHKKGTTE